ncbi:hypothetical protein F0562_021674 [Nyssa sinensis]|uniref:Uncharacterized protein n=1 Tax=Nyssa sinensis TaxID=561372 RepID=A0A5J5BN61_9ASTE|nr:hypothetical protein F0562_021674 [Nyssa sinensis]
MIDLRPEPADEGRAPNATEFLGAGILDKKYFTEDVCGLGPEEEEGFARAFVADWWIFGGGREEEIEEDFSSGREENKEEGLAGFVRPCESDCWVFGGREEKIEEDLGSGRENKEEGLELKLTAEEDCSPNLEANFESSSCCCSCSSS